MYITVFGKSWGMLRLALKYIEYHKAQNPLDPGIFYILWIFIFCV